MTPADYLTKNSAGQMAFLQQLIRLRTVNPPGENYREITALLAAKLRAIGLQVRLVELPRSLQKKTLPGLLDYPRGKSAMVHYAAAEDLRAAAIALTAAHPDVDWLCRHTEGVVDDPAALAADLVRMFTARFGRAPSAP